MFHVSSNQDAHILISTIISIAKALGKKVVAEGLETQEQLEQLTALDCDFIQGYYFPKPMLAQKIIPYLKQQQRVKPVI
jgi:EAL domain-containing protein (putative c-di-GMP-specific phosphodiesterase class I)